VRDGAIEAHRGRRPVRLMCRVLGVPPGGIHVESAARGEACRVNTVARLMRRRRIAAATRRKSRCTTDSDHDRPVAEGLVGRQSEPTAADRARAAAITWIPAREGWLSPAAVEDLHWRRIAGRSMSERVDSRLVVDAPEMAASRRPPGAGLVAHSDRGSRYASEHCQRLLAGHGTACSMSRRADCRGSAPMGSFFAAPKKELVHDEGHATRAGARASLFEYIAVSYDRVRRHSSLGSKSPVESERAG
jgi:putative transposase